MNSLQLISSQPFVSLALPHIEKLDLIKFYHAFICSLSQHLPEQTNIVLIGNDQELEALQLPMITGHRIKRINESVFDIWIRDYAPIISGNRIVEQVYFPSYYSRNELTRLGFSFSSAQLICRTLCKDIPFLESRLILDGGNFSTNREGDAIISTRIFADNPAWSKKAIENELYRTLAIERIFFIGCEPGDETGHVDGIVRFVNKETVIVGHLPDEYIPSQSTISKKDYEECRDYLNSVAEELSQYFKVIRLTDLPPSKEYKQGISSAYGNYVNFFRYAGKIFIPQYGDQEADANARNILQDAFQDIHPVLIPIDCRILASYGGVLNCITWER
ncbi:hypothetical protein FACS189431_6550 [Alphaproteobacteria bacterium]|nr:hypothetical protein FACS189431_6550 [Alphaproteobacteria bacterium]